MALAVFFSLSIAAPASAEQDPWWGPDKKLHFAYSIGLAGSGYLASVPWVEDLQTRALVGSGFSLFVGVGKEVYDWTGRGTPSWKDVTWDVLGTALGVGISVSLDALFFSTHPPEPQRQKAHEPRRRRGRP